MLPSPSSSPLRDTTNVTLSYVEISPQRKLHSFFSIPSPPGSVKPKRRASQDDERARKRVKLDEEEEELVHPVIVERSAYSRRPLENPRAYRGPAVSLASTAVLKTFVSSCKTDNYVCQSLDTNVMHNPPYACAYSHDSRRGGKSLLAVATEKGTVHIFDTTKRNPWEFPLPPSIIQAHDNGIFDVKWNITDTLLATCSGDQTSRIHSVKTSQTLYTLRGHTGTPKCVSWDPFHADLLSTGGRDGSIHIWDIRTSGDTGLLKPVISITRAHDETTKRKSKTPTRTISGLVYNDQNTFELISAGSFDGILKSWDIRYIEDIRKTKTARFKGIVRHSLTDATTKHNSRRPRGIVSVASGCGATAGVLFALAADSRIHAYSLLSLQPLSVDYTHKRMQTNSFYLGLSVSSCGRWIASGNTGANAGCFLFDVQNAASPFGTPTEGVELRGQKGENVGIDWSQGSVATCSDDGTVRVWRPDLEQSLECLRDPDASRWHWGWGI